MYSGVYMHQLLDRAVNNIGLRFLLLHVGVKGLCSQCDRGGCNHIVILTHGRMLSMGLLMRLITTCSTKLCLIDQGLHF